VNEPVVTHHAGVDVVRDDLLPGGTKARYFEGLFAQQKHVVYASPTFGGAQIGLAYAAAACGRLVTLFVPERKTPHPRTLEARAAGAQVFMVQFGRQSVLQARARKFASDRGAYLMPFGGDTPEAQLAISKAAARLWKREGPWDEVWCAAGSGTLTRGLQIGMPLAKHCAVRVGARPQVGSAELFITDVPFETVETREPPFPSCPNYDAKAWFVMGRRQSDDGKRRLFWNVIGPSPTPFASAVAKIAAALKRSEPLVRDALKLGRSISGADPTLGLIR
jgi:hypothetical protein